METGEPLLQVDSLSLTRAGRSILRNVILSVKAGQIHALIGPNGSGKSSLAYALMGCAGYEPDSGRIRFAGQEINDLPIDQRARLGMTLAWQEPARFEGLAIGQYLALGVANVDQDRVLAALSAVNLPAQIYLRRAVDATLSGGERKRVELAAVYTMHPRLAILDEPDSGIDTLSLADIGALIQRMAQAGSAVLLITHRNEIADMADVASILCIGSVVFSGDPAQARRIYQGRCEPHIAALGVQPWNGVAPVDLQRAREQ